jgi:hypothetical protein
MQQFHSEEPGDTLMISIKSGSLHFPARTNIVHAPGPIQAAACLPAPPQMVYAQMGTLFVLQGTAMDTKMGSFTIPAASLSAVNTIAVMICVLLYDRVVRLCPVKPRA